ncbi:MAG: hypothetical protein ACR2NP_21180 [Pirellulaceae bacterium]
MNAEAMNAEANSQEFDKTIQGDDFDFDFDEDFETETTAEYLVMDAMRFDREAGTASCNFELDEDDPDPAKPFQVAGSKDDSAESEKKASPPKSKAKKKG